MLKRSLDISTVMVAGMFFMIGCLFVYGAWNMRGSTGHLLIPAADDWNMVDAFGHYVANKSYFHDIFTKNMGHPQFLIALVSYAYYFLGCYSYKNVIATHVLLQLIPAFLFMWVVLKEKSLPFSLKVLLASLPLLFLFDINWWYFLRIIQGYLWSYGYLSVYIALFLATRVTEESHKTVLAVTVFSGIAFHFFAAAFAVWPALFYFAYASAWPRKYYKVLTWGMLLSLLIYLLMGNRGTHAVGSNFTMVLRHPLTFVEYMILIFGNNSILDYRIAVATPIQFFYASLVFFLALFLFITTALQKSSTILERYLATLLIFSFMVICFVAFGRLEETLEQSPYHYEPCVIMLYLPMIALSAVKLYRLCGRLTYVAVITCVLFFLQSAYTFTAVTQNDKSVYPPSRAPDYERLSLMMAMVSDSPLFIHSKSLITSMANHHIGFIRWPGLQYMNQIVGKDIPLSNQQCRGIISTHAQMNLTQWQLLELTGWVWNDNENKIPSYVLITDSNNRVLSVAAGERTQIMRQVEKKSTWLTYVPYEKLNNLNVHQLKIWLLNAAQQACYVNQYSVSVLLGSATETNLFVAGDYGRRKFIPT